ncbi:type II toxin-antitoxin system VapC family toxin [Candidatus Parabeggiatoa sp. HSG14]|uniref:type II toxin-antitoxin system VapC family toxin n=1 Tax=Candidatus Parabeggiatoa sp. HSG14 TaxID=3055593 RepID=UPI0025A824C1|nr:type II toxin-antitoxin system VapC family toxin [Thiotrichales bacterium HSG14]
MNFLCDSNSVSELMKPKPNEMVEEWFSHQNFIFMSVVSIEEIYYGLTYKDAYQKKAWFENFVQSCCEVLPVTTDIAKQCGILRGQFRQQGITRSQADLLIGATALQYELVLVTRNTKDFKGCSIKLFNPFGEPKNNDIQQ